MRRCWSRVTPRISGRRTRPRLPGFGDVGGKPPDDALRHGLERGRAGAQLRALGADPAEIEAIVLSHGHFDHTIGLNGLASSSIPYRRWSFIPTPGSGAG